jgi:pimeloyl-ACP methyl ester carboxylesterase
VSSRARRLPAGVELISVELSHGAVCAACAGSGAPVVLLHQTPRSWDEYRDVLPLLAAHGYRAIAFDTPGFGDSAPLPGGASIVRWSETIHSALDELGIERAAFVGHHTGGVIAVELAAQRPERVRALVLSSTPLTDAAYRGTPPDESGVDAAKDAEGLRRSRAHFYPDDRPDLLDRYVADALRALPLALDGHRAVGEYAMEAAIGRLTMPVLLIGADADPYAYPQLARMRVALGHAEVHEIRGGMVPLPDGWPDMFATTVADFLDRVR